MAQFGGSASEDIEASILCGTEWGNTLKCTMRPAAYGDLRA